MLRWLVVTLLFANLAFFAWTRGQVLRAEREPDRHAQQVRPEAVRLLPPPRKTSTDSAADAASSADFSASAATTADATASSPAATRCFEAGPFNSAEAAAAEAALAASPAASVLEQRWSRISTEVPGKLGAASAVHHLRIEAATPAEAAVIESLPAGLLSHAFAPCTLR